MVNIKQLTINGEIVNAYLCIIEATEQIMIAIPDVFWSIELDVRMNSDDIKEELIMQLFAFVDEEAAIHIASNLTKWIVNDFKGD
nr:YueH family protein [Staphylococcus sp. GDX8P54P]